MSGFQWWHTAVIYQIYPRSFMDGNGDGVGDLAGIISRLDYLQDLGIDAIWISPIYPSPMADFGYDVSDYTDIDPLFGDLATFDRLLEAIHRRGMRLILDWVPNHTSDEHPWFIESRASRENPRRDWYIWKDAKPDGSPPNNWRSFFGGLAWEWDATTEQYYLHLFDRKQPDLNWRNPEVKASMFETLRFWMERGVDGFRMDVVSFIIKDEQFRDNPVEEIVDDDVSDSNPIHREQRHIYDIDRPEVHDVMREIRAVIDAYPERVSIGEIWTEPLARWAEFFGQNGDELHLPFHFGLLFLPWQAQPIRVQIEALEAVLPPGAWPSNVLGSHDASRLATRFGPQAVRTAAMLLLTLRGTPVVYMGEEIGMVDGVIPADKIQDPQGINSGAELSRDPCRTPFQWSEVPYAGFSTVEPWLPVAEGYEQRNVAAQQVDPHSVLNLYKRLLAYRKSTPALQQGAYHTVTDTPDMCYAYLREYDGQRRLIVLSFADAEQTLSLDAIADRGKVAVSSGLDREGEDLDLSRLRLGAHEGLIIEI